MSITLLCVCMSPPPPNSAWFETDEAPKQHRATLKEALLHNPEVTLKISTTFEALHPPPKRARFETDVAASQLRATVRKAVVHNPEVTLKISTTLDAA
jgi:hypothetical protein